jgi:hypothetical protein
LDALKEICENCEKVGEGLIAIEITENLCFYISLESQVSEMGEVQGKQALVIDPYYTEVFAHKKDCMDLINAVLQEYRYEVIYFIESARHSLIGIPVAILGFVSILQKQFETDSTLDLFALVLYSMGPFLIPEEGDEEEEEGEGVEGVEGMEDEEIGMIIGDDDEEMGSSSRDRAKGKESLGGPAQNTDGKGRKWQRTLTRTMIMWTSMMRM